MRISGSTTYPSRPVLTALSEGQTCPIMEHADSDTFTSNSSTSPQQLHHIKCKPIEREVNELSVRYARYETLLALFLRATIIRNLDLHPNEVELCKKKILELTPIDSRSEIPPYTPDEFATIWTKITEEEPLIAHLAEHFSMIRKAPNVEEKIGRAVQFLSYYPEIYRKVSIQLEYSFDDYLITSNRDVIYRFEFADYLDSPHIIEGTTSNFTKNNDLSALSKKPPHSLFFRQTYSECYLTAILIDDFDLASSFDLNQCKRSMIDIAICVLISRGNTEYLKGLLSHSSVYENDPAKAKFAFTELLKFTSKKQNKEAFDYLVNLKLSFDLSEEETNLLKGISIDG